MERRLAVTFCCILIAALELGATAEEYNGKLSPSLRPGQVSYPATFSPVSADGLKSLPAPLAAGDRAFSTTLKVAKTNTATLLVVPAQGSAYIYVDLDRNGKFAKKERFVLSDQAETSFNLPLSGAGIYKKYPIRLFVVGVGRPNTTSAEKAGPSANRKAEPPMQPRLHFYSKIAVTQGFVKIGGKKTLVEYPYDSDKGMVSIHSGLVAMDGNGDGKIDADPAYSPEVAPASDKPIFRVGSHYVSTKSADAQTGKIVLESHPASEYTRIEFTPGTQIPDFFFTDFDGNAHKLSDLRGKYVLLDFWGVW